MNILPVKYQKQHSKLKLSDRSRDRRTEVLFETLIKELDSNL